MWISVQFSTSLFDLYLHFTLMYSFVTKPGTFNLEFNDIRCFVHIAHITRRAFGLQLITKRIAHVIESKFQKVNWTDFNK